MSYWSEKGKYQNLYSKYSELVPDSGKSTKPHIELLRNVSNVYHDFFNNGNDNWYSVIKNGKIDSNYKPPANSPIIVKEFFQDIKYDEEQYAKYNRSSSNFEPDVTILDEDEIGAVIDATLLYIDEIEKKKSKTQPKAVKAVGHEYKVLNPDTGKYVDMFGPKGKQVLQKYATELAFK